MRRRLTLISTALLLCLAAPAHAGEYDVFACNAAAGGVNQSWEPFSSNPQTMAVFSRCGEGEPTGNGLTARNVVTAGGGSTRVAEYSQWSIKAPAGAVISAAGMIATVATNANTWSATGQWVDTGGAYRDALQTCNGLNCRNSVGDRGAPRWFAAPPGGASELRYLAQCGSFECASRDQVRAIIDIYGAVVRIADGSTPSLGALGGLWGDGWQRGRRRLSYQASDNVGIRIQRLNIDGRGVANDTLPCDYTRKVPCGNVGAGAIDAETGQFGDGRHRLRVEVVDTAGNPAAAERDVLFDNTAPGAIPGLAVVGGEGWRRDNSFDVTWQKPSAGSNQSPITGLRYEICRGSTCGATQSLSADTTKAEKLEVPGGEVGEATFRLWAVDEAGNADKSKGSTVPLRFDNLAPDSVLFDPQDPADPRRLAAKVVDRGSGLATGRIEFRLAERPEFVPLPTRAEGDRLVAFVDDENLPDGTYELRAIAADRAGNEATGDRRPDGALATVVAPLRTPTRLGVDFVRALRAKASRTRITARSGRRVLVGGLLTLADGRPLAGAEVTVYATADRLRAEERVEGRVTTRPSGRFRYTSPAGTSRTLRFRYEGTPTIRSVTSLGRIAVPARLSLRTDRRSVGRGGRVVFSGRVTTRPRPVRGTTVILQAYSRGRWRTFGSARTSRSGAFRYRYRASGRNGSFRTRAVLRKQPTYPFARGTSNVRRFTIR